jgi:hypothetical protein
MGPREGWGEGPAEGLGEGGEGELSAVLLRRHLTWGEGCLLRLKGRIDGVWKDGREGGREGGK